MFVKSFLWGKPTSVSHNRNGTALIAFMSSTQCTHNIKGCFGSCQDRNIRNSHESLTESLSRAHTRGIGLMQAIVIKKVRFHALHAPWHSNLRSLTFCRLTFIVEGGQTWTDIYSRLQSYPERADHAQLSHPQNRKWIHISFTFQIWPRWCWNWEWNAAPYTCVTVTRCCETTAWRRAERSAIEEMPFRRRQPTPLELAATRKLLAKYRWRNAGVASVILGGVVAIYAYSMYAVKQDSFLDSEFDEKKSSWTHFMFSELNVFFPYTT